MPSQRWPDPWVAVASIVPVLLSIAALLALLRPPGPGAATAPQAAELDRRLGEAPLELLLLGNSIPKRNLDADALGYGLGLSVTDATLHATNAATWYVMLEDRVYANGYQPRTVLIVSPVTNLLELTPDGHRARAVLSALSNGYNPVVERRMGGGDRWAGLGVPGLDRLSVKGAILRSSLLDGVRNRAVGLLFAPPGPEPLAERGALQADAAVQAVLGDGGQVAAGLSGWSGAAGSEGPIPMGPPEASFVADIVELVQRHGGQLVFAQLPIRDPEQLKTPEMLAATRALARYLDAHQVPFVDLSGEPVRREEFEDLVHMTPAGATRMTGVVVDALLARGVLDGAPFTPNEVAGAVAEVSREGQPPALALGPWRQEGPCRWVAALPGLQGLLVDAWRLGVPGSPLRVEQGGQVLPQSPEPPAECAGQWWYGQGELVVSAPGSAAPAVSWAPEAALEVDIDPLRTWGAVTPHDFHGTVVKKVLTHWVPPGTTLRFSIPDGTPGAPLWTSAVVLQGDGARAELRVDGAVVPTRSERHVLRAGPLPTASRSAELSWSSPPGEGSPWLLVRELWTGQTADPQWLVGSPRTFSMPLDLLPVAGAEIEVHYAGPPPPIEQEPWYTEQGVGWIDVTGGPWLDLNAMRQLADREACVPVYLQAGEGRMHVRARTQGASFERPRRAELDMAQARLVWSPERRCTWWPIELSKLTLGLTPAEEKRARLRAKGPPRQYFEMLGTQRWLYPGDTATLRRTDTDHLQGLARRLAVQAYRPGESRALQLSLLVDGQPRQTWEIPAADGDELELSLALSEPLRGDEGPVEIRAHSEGFVMFRQLALTEALGTP
jgi:hypothetical protein